MNLEAIEQFLDGFERFVWGPPLLLFLFAVGLFLTILLRGVQFSYLFYAFTQIFARQKKGSEGDISHFEALMTTLAGAIGTGSIVGVATAVTLGGFGALFWMWVTALFGMALKYGESLLAVHYRVVDHRGEMLGGPMEYIERGVGWRWMAILYAILGFFAALSSGNLVQVNSIAESVGTVWELNPWVSGVIIAAFTGVVIVGGVKSIGHVAGVLVPLMALFYLAGGLLIILLNLSAIPSAFAMIFTSAFTGQAAVGGFAGATVMAAVQLGVSRSIFSNEAGLGISSIAAAAAQTDSPGRQAMITMTGALLSTIVVCTVTGLALAVTGVQSQIGVNGAPLSGATMAIRAFEGAFPGSQYIVVIGLILFAFSTVIAWAYYGEKCCEYLFGERSIFPYRLLYTLIVIPSAVIKMEMAWSLANIFNGLMCIPNLIALIILSSVIRSETKKFLQLAREERYNA